MQTRMIIIVATTMVLSGCGAVSDTNTPTIAGSISEDFLCGMDRVVHCRIDIDHDGNSEWFLGSPATRGNAGMSYLILKRDGEVWRPMGEIFLHPMSFRVLPLASDGSLRLLRYHRLGGSEGVANTLTHRNGQFVVLDSETIRAGDSGTDEGRRRYAELFLAESPNKALLQTWFHHAAEGFNVRRKKRAGTHGP